MKKADKCKCSGVPHYLLELADGTVCSICFKALTQDDVKKRIRRAEKAAKKGASR